jgi:hypothetical protein
MRSSSVRPPNAPEKKIRQLSPPTRVFLLRTPAKGHARGISRRHGHRCHRDIRLKTTENIIGAVDTNHLTANWWLLPRRGVVLSIDARSARAPQRDDGNDLDRAEAARSRPTTGPSSRSRPLLSDVEPGGAAHRRTTIRRNTRVAVPDWIWDATCFPFAPGKNRQLRQRRLSLCISAGEDGGPEDRLRRRHLTSRTVHRAGTTQRLGNFLSAVGTP